MLSGGGRRALSSGFVVLWRLHLGKAVQMWDIWYGMDARRLEGI